MRLPKGIGKMSDRIINIAIDGPSGAGKSTLAKMIAKARGYIYVDTGAMYRAIGLYMVRNGVNISDSSSVENKLGGVSLSLEYDAEGTQRVILCGEDVSGCIRTPEISDAASKVSAIPKVREFLLDVQRNMAKTHSVVMDGRDIGTVILPNADVKIFLTATPEGRAERRFKELTEKGIETTYEAVLADQAERDRRDRERETAPAVAAEDAVVFDNSNYSKEEMLAKALEIIDGKTENAK